jgi:uncharacterized membrane protein YfcA
MLHPDIPVFVLASAVFFAAGIVKGVLGMGLPTFAMGFLGLLMPVPQAAALLTLPSFVTNVWQAGAGGALGALLRRLWPFLAGIAAGVAAAAVLPAQGDRTARVLLGACLLLYGLSGWAGWRLPAPSPRAQFVAGPIVGAVTGVITAWTGVFVLPAVPWLQSLGLDRNRLSQALGLSFTVSTVALAALLASRGQWGLSASLQSAIALLPALAGMWIGQLVRQQMGEAVFRRCFFGGLVVLGGWLAMA